jgi:hypothetical protein
MGQFDPGSGHLVKRHLEAGHRLVGLERHLLSQRLSPAERQELAASENRRNALLGKYPQTLARSEGWRNTADLFDDTIRVSAVNNRLMQAESAMSVLRYTENLNAVAPGAQAISPEFQQRVSALRNSIYRTLELIRSQQVRKPSESGNHRQLRRLTGVLLRGFV